MRKYIRNIAAIVLFSALNIVLFTSCIGEPTDSDNEVRPDVEISNSSVTIAIQKISNDTKYINVYRKDTTTKKVLNIGIIFPKNFDSNTQTYIFEDSNVVKDLSYSYMVRYCNKNDAYVNTDWSKAKKVTFGSSSADNLIYTVDAQLNYTANDKSLQIIKKDGSTDITITEPSDITDFTTKYKPALAFETADAAKVISITDKQLDGTEKISLIGFLPEDFLNTEVTIIGLIGQCVEYKEKSTTEAKRVYWTAPTPIKVKDSSNNTIQIDTTTNNDGYDYSYPTE